MKQAIITSFLGKLRDRFCEYQEPLSIEQKLERMTHIPGVSGAEVVHPYEVDTAEIMRSHLQRLKLDIAAINVNIKADPVFAYGSLTSPDPLVRRKACEMIKAAKDYAQALGADKVTCCPLSDGYDYPFHTDYRKAWSRMVEVVREAADYLPAIPLFMEYKPSETRVHCTLDSAAKTLMLCQAVGSPHLGVTIDIGHSIYGGETPAEALAHVAVERVPLLRAHQRQQRQMGLGPHGRDLQPVGLRRVPLLLERASATTAGSPPTARPSARTPSKCSPSMSESPTVSGTGWTRWIATSSGAIWTAMNACRF